MKKRTIRRIAVAGLLLALLLLACSAAAEENPVNPYYPEIQESLIRKEAAREEWEAGIRKRGPQVTVEISGTIAPCQELMFTATVTGTENPEELRYEWYFSDEGRDPYGYVYIPGFADGTTGNNTVPCFFYSAGHYSYWVEVYRGNTYICQEYNEFEIEEDGNHLNIEGKVAEIVQASQGTTDWDTAVNLHDWLTMNAYYDTNYEYYGAEGVLLRGYGVCDSYSKAYVHLCQAAGIPVDRITGGGHAWNAIQLNGEWYLVDPTWDDPVVRGYENDTVSGFERHDYFCLNDELMGLDHSGSFSEPCNSLDANWLIRTGNKNQMGDNISYDGSSSYTNRILQKLNNGETSFTVDCESSFFVFRNVTPSGGYSYSPYEAGSATATRNWTLLAAYLSQTPMTLDNGDEVNVSVTYDASGNCFVCEAEEEIRIEGTCGAALTWVLEDDGTLVISGTGEMYNFDSEDPPSWIDYREQIQAVRIEDGVTSIGEYAFSGYEQLQTVHIAGSVTIIGDCAFRHCSALSSVTLADGLETVGYMAFMGCNLSEIHISTGDTKTWDFFYGTAEGQDYLCHVDLPDSVTEVSFFAFCDNLFQRDLPDAVLPADLTTIEAEAFYGTNPRFVWLPDRVDEIGDYAFAACGSLEFVYVPFDCETIGTGAFPAGTKILGIRIYDLEPCAAQQYADQHEEIEFIEYENPYGGNG